MEASKMKIVSTKTKPAKQGASERSAAAAGPERIETRTGNMKEYPSGRSPRYTTLDMGREEEMFGVSASSSLATMRETADQIARKHLASAM
ncbi:MAG: hypothetical protein QGH32_09190 [Alphaproteobacteria bacterium]|jgi:hypothetical protein|nr:hypothetical protein [Alphaproteobacteria bacterium]